MNPHFPVNTIKMMRGAIVAEEEGFLPAYMDACFNAMWATGKNMADDAVIAEVFSAAGLDAAHIAKRSGEDGVKNKLKLYTGEACERGVFGAPTFFVDGEMFFGQDRLDFVEEALMGRSYVPKKGAA
jgi:2-hydroxychromene-2-carboxylate isomerase